MSSNGNGAGLPLEPPPFPPGFTFDEGILLAKEQMQRLIGREMLNIQDESKDPLDRVASAIPALYAISDTATLFIRELMVACPEGVERMSNWVDEEGKRLGANDDPPS